MNETTIVTVYVVIDDVLKLAQHRSHSLSRLSDAEVLMVAVSAALYFHNHQERTLYVLERMGYLSGHLSISRFNRRLHKLRDWLEMGLLVLSEVLAEQSVYIIDSLPLPVCHRARAGRCRKVRGADYCGYCAAKDEKFFGWRLHLICTPAGLPIAFSVLPASYHDLTPVHDLTYCLPSGALVVADKGYNSGKDEASILAHTGVRLVVKRKDNMLPNCPADEALIAQHRRRIETVNSQLENMGIQRLHARTNAGFLLKVHASLLALMCANLN